MSEAVYNTSGGSGALEASDFALSLSGGSASLASSIPSSISASGNVYTLGVGFTGTPNGGETLTVSPVDDGIYDLVGNEAATSQSNNTASLNDQLAPTITLTVANSGGDAISSGSATNDATLTLTLTSSENTTNLNYTDVTVTGGAVSAFSGSGASYTATFTPGGNGAATIDVAAGAFTDAAGNDNTAATQFTWTYDGTAATITSTTLAANNSSIDVTLSEAVYKTSSGSGALEAGDFALSISGGSATMGSATPSAISASGNVYTLGLNISGVPDGSEVLTVSPVDEYIMTQWK